MPARKRIVEAARKRPKLQSITVLVRVDEDADASYLDQDEFDDRREQFQRGDFHFVGVRAEAEVEIEGVAQTLTSGGLWGIESDSGNEYIKEVAAEEYADLLKVLTTVGVSTAQLPAALDPRWIEWE